MVNFNQSLNQYYSSVNEIHQQIDTQDKVDAMSLNQLVTIVNKIENVVEQFNALANDFLEEIRSLSAEEKTAFSNKINIMKNDLKSTKNAVNLMGEISVRNYIDNHALTERKLILIGNCCSQNSGVTPGACQLLCGLSADISHIPNASFPKITLSYLPTPIFNNGAAIKIFEEFHRVLSMGGEVEFNNMFGADLNDFNNPFNLVLSQEELQSMCGKQITESPHIILKYNQQLATFFQKIGFTFPDDFDMHVMHSTYKIIKLERKSSSYYNGCTLS